MTFYAASTTLLPENQDAEALQKVFYANDGAGAGTLDNISAWWKDLQVQGPFLGYFPNAEKTWLIVKPEHAVRASVLFPDINVTSEG